jgi:rare lipoprotein A (peptidoglycan hydrolase)
MSNSVKVHPDVRLPRVVARAALIAALASVVVPAVAGSRIPSAPSTIDPAAFQKVDLARTQTTMTTLVLDPANRSEGSLAIDGVLREPRPNAAAPAERPNVNTPAAKAIVVETWKLDNNISWYGPGFWGNNGACGMFGSDGLDPGDVGVAHRTLPCGTKVTFRYNGQTVVTQVVDRGPYVVGRTWDMTKGLCTLLAHCFTGGGVYYRVG